MRVFDVVIGGGMVVDGTGAPPRRADVGITGDRITAIDDLSAADAAERLDGTGRVVTPGFIDTHSHLDAVTFQPGNPIHRSSARQGVTTEVCGNCGFSPFPTTPAHATEVARHLATLGAGSAAPAVSLSAWRERIADHPPAVNVAPLLGHGSLRGAVIGFDDRPPTADELDSMRRLAEQAMDEGAFGLSSGLIYAPGMYATTEEVAVLAAVAGRRGLPYATHMRDEGDEVVRAVDEALWIGRQAGAPVQISHHKIAGRRNWGRSAETLQRIEAARGSGFDVTIDAYPYTAGSTILRALLPPWVNAGGVEAMLARLGDPAARDRLAHDLDEGLPGWQNLVGLAGWDGVTLLETSGAPEVTSRRLSDVAVDRGQPPALTLADLLLGSGGAGTIMIEMMDPAEVATIVSQPYASVGSDGDERPGPQHPRTAGAFARALRLQLDRLGADALPEIVRRMTALPAERFHLAKRGRVQAGLIADLVVFDPASVADAATYADSWLPPVGIDHVLLGGVPVVRDGHDTDHWGGRILEPDAEP